MKLFLKVATVIVVLQLAWVPPTAGASPNGEEACEGKDFDESECNQVGCCHWNDDQCWSDVGTAACENENENENDSNEGLLPGFVGWADGRVVWSDPPKHMSGCGKVTVVFGVAICVTEAAFQSKAKCDHIANVFYQLLDNDADGTPDDEKVLTEMVRKSYLLLVPATENDEISPFPKAGVAQVTRTNEAVLNSCDVPTNRGASATDRSTWPDFVDTNNAGCSNERDATVEEILHLISDAAITLYPKKWDRSFKSEVGRALKAANGDCGWGYTGNWINPSSNKCSGQYAYSDATCDEGCLVVEGIYWASVTYIGGLYTSVRASWTRDEWLMTTPDSNMKVYPEGINNAVSLQSGSPKLYAMVSDTTSEGHAWLPNIMPDGKYTGFDDIEFPSPTLSPTPATTSSSSSSTSFICDDFSSSKKCNKTFGCRWKKSCKPAPGTRFCRKLKKQNKKYCKKNLCKFVKKPKKECVGYWS